MNRNDIIVLVSSIIVLASIVTIMLVDNVVVMGVCAFVSLAALVIINILYKQTKWNK